MVIKSTKSRGAGAPCPALPVPPSVRPKSNLRVEQLVDSDVFLVHDVLDASESAAYCAYAERLGPTHQGSRGAAYGEAFRDNDRTSVDDPLQASKLWTALGLAEVFAELDSETSSAQATGLNPNLRLYRYRPGQRFGRHVDDSVRVGAGLTRFTLLVYLSAPRGGETVFYLNKRKSLAVAPKPGLALLHRHGDCCLEHEGRAVAPGGPDKYVLRSDVVYGRM